MDNVSCMYCALCKSNDVGPTGQGIPSQNTKPNVPRPDHSPLSSRVYEAAHHALVLTFFSLTVRDTRALLHIPRHLTICLHSLYSPRNPTWIYPPTNPFNLPHDIPPAPPFPV